MTRGLGNLIGMTLAVATAGTAMAQTPVTVTILRFVQGQDPDPVQVADAISGPDTIGDGDYYARVRIGSASPRRNRSDFIESRDFQPFWTFTDIVDADDGVIPVVIQMWDADPIENNDDIIDLNPTDGSQELVLNLDLATCEWTGDAGASDDPNATGRFSRGDGDGEHFGAAEGGERGTILFDVACSRNGDIDDDGIPDGVERLGIVDTDGNLVQDLRGLADPCRKTLLVENDFMAGAADGHTHQPSPVALAELVAAFDGAGLLVDTLSPSSCPYAGFPTQTGGIGLVMLMDDAISEQAQVPIGNLDQIRNTNFDPALRPYVHYALWAHNITRNGTVMGSGWCCAGDGKDFFVSLGNFGGRDATGNTQNGTDRNQSGTFMHEFGHALGLQHWGADGLDVDANGDPVDANNDGDGDGRNCKPNYISVMNYYFQLTGIADNATGRQAIDYSRKSLDPLDESALVETDGVDDGDLVTAWCDPSRTMQTGVADGSFLDWNLDGFAALGGTISADIAAEAGLPPGVSVGFAPTCCSNANGTQASAGEQIRGFDDWGNLTFRAAMASGATAPPVVVDSEPLPEDAERMQDLWDRHLRCSPPESGEWRIARDCTIWRDVTAPGDLIVAAGVVLTVGAGVRLDLDLAVHALRVEAGARLNLQTGARID